MWARDDGGTVRLRRLSGVRPCFRLGGRARGAVRLSLFLVFDLFQVGLYFFPPDLSDLVFGVGQEDADQFTSKSGGQGVEDAVDVFVRDRGLVEELELLL